MLAASRCRLGSLLLAHNGRVARFDTTKETMMQHTGLFSGVRVRAFSGAKIGQIGIVVGTRNNALWLRWGDSTRLEPISYRDLPRIDFRPIDLVEIDGLDPEEHEEGDTFISPLFTSEGVTEEAKVPIVLDDAAAQHFVNEMGTGKACELSLERHQEAEIRTAVENLRLQHEVAEKVIRVLRLESPSEPRLNSKEAIYKYITSERRVPGNEAASDAEIFTRILARRVALFDGLSTVRIFTNEFKLPNAVLKQMDTHHSLSNNPWVASVPSIPAEIIGKNFTLGNWKGKAPVSLSDDVPLRSIAESVIQLAQSAEGDLIELEKINGLTNEGRLWLKTMLLLGTGKLVTAAGVKEYIKVVRGETPVVAFEKELRKRQEVVENATEIVTASGATHRIPTDAIRTAATEVEVVDAPWCREIVNSHRLLNALKNLEPSEESEGDAAQDMFYGKVGTVTATDFIGKGVPEKLVEQFKGVAEGVLHEFALFRGRHMLPEIPEADVFVLEGKYRYLSKAAAKELYQNAEDPPVLYDATGRPIYKTNAWFQPFNMVNDRGLEEFAPAAKYGGRYYRKSVFYPHATPAPMGR